jgi:hypothetical protein
MFEQLRFKQLQLQHCVYINRGRSARALAAAAARGRGAARVSTLFDSSSG